MSATVRTENSGHLGSGKWQLVTQTHQDGHMPPADTQRGLSTAAMVRGAHRSITQGRKRVWK